MCRTPIVRACLFLLLLAASSRAEPPDPFLQLAGEYHPEDRHRLPEVRTRILGEVPGLFGRPLPPCPLRSALAKAMSVDEARAWLSRPDRDADALAVVVDNLAARPDLATLVLDTPAYERLEPGHVRLLSDVALNALLDGDDRLIRELLAGPGWWQAADGLSRLPHPEGLQLFADVVTGAVPIPGAARARLALFEPDVQNDRPVRPLGRGRVEALLAVAKGEEDAALRALAARTLLRSNDPAFAVETVRAFVAAHTVHLGSIDWHHVAKLAPVPVTDPRISIEHRLDMFESWLLWTWIRARQEPLDAEAHAAALRPVLASAEPRFRGEAILTVADHVGVFVTTTHGRGRAVPSFLGILDDLEAGRPSDAEPLTALAREAAARMRAEIAEEEGYPAVRLPDRPFVTEAAWRPCARTVDTALAGVLDGIDSVERYDAALARVEEAGLPPDARHRVLEHLIAIALGGGPAGPEEEDGDGDDESLFDRRYLDRLCAWIGERAPLLDAGLPEVLVKDLLSSYVPAELERHLRQSIDTAIDHVPRGGPRLRLEALRERSR